MAERRPTMDELAMKQSMANVEALRYSRKRFLWTWLALGLLAFLVGGAAFFALRANDTNLEQTDDIARLARASAHKANQSTDDITAYLRGEQGIAGVPGTNGQDGSPGQPGAGEPGGPGPKGDQGEAGSPGAPGAQGPSGPSGPMGSVGSAGNAGQPGAQGPEGLPGTDATGATGPKGDKGEKGDKGDTGPTGADGPAGPQGPAGSSPAPSTITVAAASANDATAQKNVQATCTSGRVSGGGYAILPANPLIVPTTTSTVGNGWQVTANASAAFTGNWQVFAFALCVS